MYMILGNTQVTVCSTGLCTAKSSFKGKEFCRFVIFRLPVGNNLFYFFKSGIHGFCISADQTGERCRNIHLLIDIIIQNGNISGCFISYMYIMALLYQTGKGTSHGNNVIVRMRTENQHPFRIWICPFRTGRVICIRFSSRPSGNCMLQVIENLDIYFIGRTESFDQIAHAVVHIVLVFNFQDGLIDFLTQPDNSFADQFIVPLYFAYQPGMIGSR